jgi:tripartite-type tricarboxylate transporter receptor subunit TctC
MKNTKTKYISMFTQLLRQAVIVVVAVGITACSEQSTDEPYQGRQITILVGSGPGGVTDTSARIIASFLENYLPGNPTVIVQNMPGGGSVAMANHLYRSAARDGTVLGYSLPGLVAAQLMEPDRAKYDGRKLNWIGSAITVTNAIAVLNNTPVETLEDARDTNIIIGATGRGSLLYQLPAMAKELLNLKIQIITGYQGSSEIALAMERGEVHGQATALDYWSLSRPDWISNGRLKYLAYVGPPDPRTPNTPHLNDLVSSQRDKDLIKVLEIGSKVGWPLFAPPEIPKQQLESLRLAFSQMLQDQAFAEAIETSMRTSIHPIEGKMLKIIVETALSTPESVITEAKELLGI